MNRSALIRVPLGWGNVSNLTKTINPQQKSKLGSEIGRQTVELRSPDGSCNTHMLLAGIALAAEWGLSNSKESLELAKQGYVSVNIHDSDTVQDLPELATSCAESAEILLSQRDMYERDNIFTPQVIDFMATMLQNENDKGLSKRLMALPDDEKLQESRRIMHRDIHKH